MADSDNQKDVFDQHEEQIKSTAPKSDVFGPEENPSAEPTDFEKNRQENFYGRLTNPTYRSEAELKFQQEHPILGMGERFLSSTGATVLGMPGSLYQTARHPLDTIGDVAGSLSEYAKPSTWEAIPSILPEALGVGTGAAATGEVMKGLPKVSEMTGRLTRFGPGEANAGELRPWTKMPGTLFPSAARIPFVANPEWLPEHPNVLATGDRALVSRIPNRLKLPEVEEPPAPGELYEQKAQDLMRRQAEQDALDREAAKNVPRMTPFGGEGVTATNMPSLTPMGQTAPPEVVGPLSMGKPTPFSTTSPGTLPKFVEKFEPQGRSRIVEPGSEPPDVKVTYQSYPRETLVRMAAKGDLEAIRELQRNPAGHELPPNTKYLIEEAGTKPWRNYKH